MSRWSMVVGTAALAALVVAGCGKDDKGNEKPKPAAKPAEPKKPEPPKPLTANELVQRSKQAWSAFNSGDMAAFGKFYAANATLDFVGSGQPTATGRDAVLGAIGQFRTALPDLKGESAVAILSGHTAVSVDIMVGTHKGDLMGVPPTEKTLGMPVIHVFHLNDQGEVTKELAYFDPAAMMGQMGVVEGPHRAALEHSGASADYVIAEDSDVEKANLEAIKASDMAMAAGDDAKAMELLSEDIVVHDYTMPEDVEGLAKIKEMNEMWKKAFPDAKYETEWAVAAGDYVARGGTVSGTNKGPIPMMGVKKATGKTVTFSFAEVCRFEDGKIVETWSTGNTIPVAVALGLMPDPNAAAPEGDKAEK